MIGVTVTRKSRGKLPKASALSGDKEVAVGFPAGKSDGDIQAIATYNHYGTKRIPPRPFLKIAMAKNRNKYRAELKALARLSLSGSVSVEAGLRKIGIEAVGDVQKTITDLRTPANAASTIRAKGSDNPLIDQGRMRSAVTYVVR